MPSVTPPDSDDPKAFAGSLALVTALLAAAFGSAALIAANSASVAATWATMLTGAVVVGVVAYRFALGRAQSDRRHQQRLHSEWELQQIAVEKALSELDAARAELKQVEALRETAREIEQRCVDLQSQAALGRMAGGVAHSFNNMLVGIMGYASAVEEINHLTPAEMRQYLSQINAASQRASGLCNQLMVAAGRRTAEREVVFLRRFRTEIEPLLAACVGRGATLTLELAPHLPRVRADLGGLQVALANLTFNALDAIAGGGNHLTLTITPETIEAAQIGITPEMSMIEPGPHVLFALEDDGSGMSDETRARAFEPFFTTKPGRMGLGLAAIARWVRRRHGGMLLKPAPAGGTRVELFLPALPGTDDPDDNTRPIFETLSAVPAASADASSAAKPTVPRRVLFIDDDQTVRDLGSMLITQLGLEVVCAADGEAGEIAARDQGPFGLALVDYSMPGRDGIETIKSLRQHQPDLRIVLISGSIKSDIEGLEQVEPLDGFLQKPFNYSAAKTLLEQLFGAS